MTVYTMSHCANTQCINSDDLIQITMKEEGSMNYDKVLLKTGIETGRYRDRKWILEEIFFEAVTDEISVKF